MYLSRIKLDTSREAKRAIASPQIIHASIEACFDRSGRNLWRLDYLRDNFYLLLVSETVPNFTSFAKQFCTEDGETKQYAPILSRIKAGQQLRFRLKGNTVHSKAGERGTRGKVLPHVTEYHKKEWLNDKSAANGFSVEDGSFDLIESGIQRWSKKRPVTNELSHKGSQLDAIEADNKQRRKDTMTVELTYGVFEGILTVVDADLFVNALTHGIGRAKAYGCGLITVMGVQ